MPWPTLLLAFPLPGFFLRVGIRVSSVSSEGLGPIHTQGKRRDLSQGCGLVWGQDSVGAIQLPPALAMRSLGEDTQSPL